MKDVRRILVLLLALCVPLAMAAPQFEENTNYEAILPEPPIGKPGEPIEVVEFFMWGCPHCYRFEPFVQEWLQRKPDDVVFVRIPAMFGGPANLHAKVFYALQAMGELDRLHQAFFHEIHEKGNRMTSRDQVEAFLERQGVDIARFRETMDSFAVAARTNRAASLMRRYGIRAVPSLVIDGRYRSGRGLDYKELAELVDFLVERVRRERREESE